MQLTMRFKEDLLALLDIAKKKKAAAADPIDWSDSKASRFVFGHGEFVADLRKWKGGKGGPTLESARQFEAGMRKVIGEVAYREFTRTRGATAAAE